MGRHRVDVQNRAHSAKGHGAASARGRRQHKAAWSGCHLGRSTEPRADTRPQPSLLTSPGWERIDVLVTARLLRILLVVLVLSLTKLAQASPPDPTSLSGVYDDSDYDDDIVLMALSARGGSPLVIFASAPPSHESLRPPLQPSSSAPRAPPVA